MSTRDKAITYRDAGVDTEGGNRLVERIRPLAARTRRPGVLAGIGGFGALFEVPVDRYERPVLVSGADGVGTKLRLAIEHDRHDDIGIDLVAMCANDVLVTGAEPLYFLDYYATARLDQDVAARVIEGIARGCEMAGAALAGGETAEMPGMYRPGDYDLAGFCVGIVERDRIIDGSGIGPGDTLIGVASSGPHSNGYSLIRRLLEVTNADPAAPLDGRPLIDRLMEPTRIYVKSVLELTCAVNVLGMAHVTGGGLVDNVPRVLPAGTRAEVHLGAWTRAPVFDWLQESAGIGDHEMHKTFNGGVGMVVCVKPEDVAAAIESLERSGETAFEIGRVLAGRGAPRVALVAD